MSDRFLKDMDKFGFPVPKNYIQPVAEAWKSVLVAAHYRARYVEIENRKARAIEKRKVKIMDKFKKKLQ